MQTLKTYYQIDRLMAESSSNSMSRTPALSDSLFCIRNTAIQCLKQLLALPGISDLNATQDGMLMKDIIRGIRFDKRV